MNKSPIILILLVSLVIIMGCAKSDWIQSTLVTADVTGTWRDTGGNLELKLEQQGSKVKGNFKRIGAGTSGAGTTHLAAIVGDVAGDVFSFSQINGPLTGTLTVSGDEMAGSIMTTQKFRIPLQRVSPAQ